MKNSRSDLLKWLAAIGSLWLAVWIQLPRLGPEPHIVDLVFRELSPLFESLHEALARFK